MRNKVFIGVFCGFIMLILISAPLNLVLSNAGIVKAENVGNVIEVEKVYEEGSFGAPLFNAIEELKRDINDIYINYIPFYVDITSAASSVKVALNSPVTSFLMNKGNEIMLAKREEQQKLEAAESVKLEASETNAEQTTVETTTVITEPPFDPILSATYLKGDNRHRYYQITAQEEKDGPEMMFNIRVPAKDSAQLRPQMEKQVAAFNDFKQRCPDVNMYIFPVVCFEDTEMCDLLLPTESKRELFNEFFEKLDPSIQYAYNSIESFADFDYKHYRTDHHWNVYGYTEGYKLIVEMMQENYPDIVPLEPEILTFDDKVKMYGSNSLASSSYDLFDIFHAADYKLPANRTVIRESGVSYGGHRTPEESIALYTAGNHDTSRSYGHYMQFFPICKEITYHDNKTGRNLLIVGGSYTPPCHEALASHFDKTIVRYVDSNKALSTVKYEDLIAEHNITDVVFLQMSDRVIYDYYGDSLKGLY